MKFPIYSVAVVLMALSLAPSSSGYDFTDPSFNSLLTADYLEFMANDDSPLNYRAKRESPPAPPMKGCHSHKWGNREKELPSQRCCKQAIEKQETFDKVKEFKKECFVSVKGNRSMDDMEMDMFSCDRLTKKKEEIRCAYECVLKKQLIFGDDSKFDETKTLEHFRSELNDLPWVRENVDPIIKGCIAEAQKMDEDMTATNTQDETQKCSKSPMKFVFCIYREFSNKCPVDQQKDSRSCKLIREGKVEFMHHHPHHHHHHNSHE